MDHVGIHNDHVHKRKATIIDRICHDMSMDIVQKGFQLTGLLTGSRKYRIGFPVKGSIQGTTNAWLF